jgi:predicted enzyme related to lactoylglutathione lyase
MPELRRLAVIADNPTLCAEFYRNVFEIENVGAAKEAVFLSDGNFNLALVPAEEGATLGLGYLGFQMARLESIERKLALIRYTGRVIETHTDPEIEYEIQDPDGNRIGLCKPVPRAEPNVRIEFRSRNIVSAIPKAMASISRKKGGNVES